MDVQYLSFPDDYFDILSYMQQPYYQQVEYEVEDNWWHSKDYYNVPLNVFMDALKNTIRNGYTVVIGGDVSEAGYDSWHKVGVIPTFDIPSEYIDENATLGEATHQLIVQPYLSLLVTSGDEVVGILRLSDVFTKICDIIKGD